MGVIWFGKIFSLIVRIFGINFVESHIKREYFTIDAWTLSTKCSDSAFKPTISASMYLANIFI